MYDRQAIMRRAWQLFRNADMGYARFGDALRDAWAEAKGELSILDQPEPAPVKASKIRRPLDPAAVMGRLSRCQIARLAG